MGELIVLLDESLRPIGSAEKLSSHHADTPLHLAFSCYIFDTAGRFLLTRRAVTKKVWPGVWTNSVCGHPAPGETASQAIRRRTAYELGIKPSNLGLISVLLPHYRYRTPPFNGVVENEYCPVFAARVAGAKEILLNPDEVADSMWVDWDDLPEMIEDEPETYSYWFQDQLRQLAGNSVLKKFTKVI